MTEDERQYRAHLALHGQPLLIEWMARAKLRAEGGKLRAEGAKLYDKGRKLWAEGSKLWAEGAKLYAEGSKLGAEGDKLYAEGDIQWFAAVCAEYGPRAVITWDGDACTVGGHRYEYVKMLGDQP